jgi:hypothetical protein
MFTMYDTICQDGLLCDVILGYNTKFTGRRETPIRWNGLFGGGDASFLIWLVMGMPNKARQPTSNVLYPPFLNT